MHASTLARRELAVLEATILHWYPDATGTWTCCTGHTAAAGPPVYVAGQTFTAVQADTILAVDLAKVYEPAVNRRVKVPLTQYEFDAVLILTYNIGEANLAKSDLLRCLNAGDKAGAAAGFSHFTTSHGKQLTGLVSRRATERTIFLTGTYPGLKPASGQTTAEMAHTVTLGQGAKGEAVTHLQTELKTLGFLTAAADGVFGPADVASAEKLPARPRAERRRHRRAQDRDGDRGRPAPARAGRGYRSIEGSHAATEAARRASERTEGPARAAGAGQAVVLGPVACAVHGEGSVMLGVCAFVVMCVLAFLWCARDAHLAATDRDWRERWGPPRRRAWIPVGPERPPEGPVDLGGPPIGVSPAVHRPAAIQSQHQSRGR